VRFKKKKKKKKKEKKLWGKKYLFINIKKKKK